MDSINLDVKLSELHKLKDFIHVVYPKNVEVDLIVEEIFVNIVSYSQADYVIVNAGLNGNLTIEFIDDGIEFNPLLKEAPKLGKTIEDVPIGGRGLVLVKKYSDGLFYEYLNNENHLKVIKNV